MMTTLTHYTHYRKTIVDGRWVFEYGLDAVEEMDSEQSEEEGQR